MLKRITSYQSFIVFLAFYSGFFCLVLELIWSRYLQLVFGVSIYAVSTVITSFMIGFATGNGLFGYICDKTKNHHKTLLIILGSLIVFGFISPLFYHTLQSVNYYFSSLSILTTGFNIALFRIGISLVCLLIPTTLLGGLSVVLLRIYQSDILKTGSSAALLFAANTLGSAIGAFVTGFILIRFFGLQLSIWIATSGLMLLSFFFVTTSKKIASNVNDFNKETILTPLILPRKLVIALLISFGVSGFTSLAYEVLWTRILVLFFRDTVYDFAIVLTTFLMGLFVGSWICNRILKSLTNVLKTFVWIEIAIGLTSLLTIFFIARLPYITYNMQSMSKMYASYGESYWLVAIGFRFLIAGVLILPATLMFGFTLPLITQLIVTNNQKRSTHFGLLTGINTLGSTLGSLLAGFVLIDLFGTQNSIVFTALLNLLIGVVVLLLIMDGLIERRTQMLAFIMGSTVFLLAVIPAWDSLRMTTNILEPHQDVENLLSEKYYKEDATGFTNVFEFKPTAEKFLATGRLYVQNTSSNKGFGDHRRLGYIPLLLHPNSQKVLLVGLGAGVTLNGIADGNVKQIDCVEISQGITEAASFFGNVNHDVLNKSNVNLIIEDGRNFIATTNQNYDIIIADIFFPMSAGSSDLFTTEYFSLCQKALAKDGMMCQWLPAHQLSLDGIKVILKSFAQVFPNTTLWFGLADSDIPVIGFMGSKSPLKLSMSQLEKQFAQLNQTTLSEIELIEPNELLSFYICRESNCNQLLANVEPNTDDRPVIEFVNPLIKESFEQTGQFNSDFFQSMRRDPVEIITQ